MQDKIIEIINKRITDDGWHIWGFADLFGLLHERFKGFSHGITIGKRLDDSIIDSVIKGPNIQYYDLYKQTNAYLADLVKVLAEDLFVSRKFGPRLRLASLLVDYPLKPLASPIVKSRCGKCNICVEACPAGAASGMLWNTKVDRDEYYDAFKCSKKARELSRSFADPNHEICGICVSVCPIGKKGLPESKRR
ncbi:MAG: 4Fe-4S double cluster binding domain-containing protein [Dehalococcoidia bacterium]